MGNDVLGSPDAVTRPLSQPVPPPRDIISPTPGAHPSGNLLTDAFQFLTFGYVVDPDEDRIRRTLATAAKENDVSQRLTDEEDGSTLQDAESGAMSPSTTPAKDSPRRHSDRHHVFQPYRDDAGVDHGIHEPTYTQPRWSESTEVPGQSCISTIHFAMTAVILVLVSVFFLSIFISKV